MTVDEAIAYALVIRDAEDERDLALVTLAAEVKRLHTAVEAVRALQRYVVSFRRVRPPVHPYQWYWQVSLVNDVAEGDPFLTVTNGYAPDLESAKLAAVEAWRRWARERAEAAGWEVTGD